jgi:hypothetical protein
MVFLLLSANKRIFQKKLCKYIHKLNSNILGKIPAMNLPRNSVHELEKGARKKGAWTVHVLGTEYQRSNPWVTISI